MRCSKAVLISSSCIRFVNNDIFRSTRNSQPYPSISSTNMASPSIIISPRYNNNIITTNNNKNHNNNNNVYNNKCVLKNTDQCINTTAMLMTDYAKTLGPISDSIKHIPLIDNPLYYSSIYRYSTYNTFTQTQLRSYTTTAMLLADTGGGLFERYTEIDNSNEKKIKALRAAKMCESSDEWIGTEKVHGANFGVYSIDYGAKIRYAKRSGLLPDSEHFFGYQVLIPELVTCIRKVRELLEQKLEGQRIHTVIVNGELFGGKYDHPLVPKSTQKFMIRGKQKGINAVQTDQFPQYSPDLHFYAFDIKYRIDPPPPEQLTDNGTSNDSDTASAALANEDTDNGVDMLTYDEAVQIFEQVPNLLYAKAIVRGTMDEVAAFDVESFETTIPALLGLGDTPLKGNWSEGLVVKHANRGKKGWRPKGGTILKFKTVAFQEISTDRSQGARVDAMAEIRKESIAKAGVQLPLLATVLHKKDQIDAAEYLLQHVCDNRLKNLLSKIGPEPFISETISPNEVAKMLAQDSLKDFLKDSEISVINASVYARQVMVKYCLFECRKLVCRQWKDIIAKMKIEMMETKGE